MLVTNHHAAATGSFNTLSTLSLSNRPLWVINCFSTDQLQRTCILSHPSVIHSESQFSLPFLFILPHRQLQPPVLPQSCLATSVSIIIHQVPSPCLITLVSLLLATCCKTWRADYQTRSGSLGGVCLCLKRAAGTGLDPLLVQSLQ